MLAAVELPGVAEGDMLRQKGQRKHGTALGSPRRTCTAKASHINWFRQLDLAPFDLFIWLHPLW